MQSRTPLFLDGPESAEPDETEVRVFRVIRVLSRWTGQLALVVLVVAGSAIVLSPLLSESEDKSSQVIAEAGHAHLVQASAFSPDGKSLATCGLDDSVHIWHVNRGNRVPDSEPIVLRHTGIQYAVAFSGDGTLVGTVGTKSLTIWSNTSGRYQPVMAKEIEPSSCVVFSPDNRAVVVGSDDGIVTLFDLPSMEERLVLRAHKEPVRSLSFSPDGHFLVTTGEDCSVMLWDADRGQAIRELLDGSLNPIHLAAFSPDGQSIAVGELAGGRTDVLLFESNTGTLQARLTGHDQGVSALAFSPDGRTLATAGVDHCVKFWDLIEGKEQFTFNDDVGSIRSLSYSNDGAWLALAGDGVTIAQSPRVRPTSTQVVYRRLKNPDGATVMNDRGTPPADGSESLARPQQDAVPTSSGL